jgi:DNA polymerase I-like protein with 3'-5' exonuclease and polymerase domains
MARLHPAEVGPIRELRHTLGQLRLHELAVGPDGRNWCLLSIFRSKTGRNQPSNSEFVFGPSCRARSLIRPPEGRAVAYVDWSAQELGIAAYLSSDPAMRHGYVSGDPYLSFGKLAGVLPATATKTTHGVERDRLEVACLGALYGMTEFGPSRRLGLTPAHDRELLRLHQQTFPAYWRWSQSVRDQAILTGRLETVFGWREIPPSFWSPPPIIPQTE